MGWKRKLATGITLISASTAAIHMINKIIYNYSSNETKITTSLLPNTTVDLIKVKINDSLTLIDTPGILDDGNIINYLDKKEIKKLLPKKEIKPIIKRHRKVLFYYLPQLFLSPVTSRPAHTVIFEISTPYRHLRNL